MAEIPEPEIKQVDTFKPNDPWYKKTWDYFVIPNLFELTHDWKVTLPTGEKVLIPAGFQFDGASIPWFLRWLATSFGPLLRAGLLHDYGYRYGYLLNWAGQKIFEGAGQKYFDDLFRQTIKVTTGLSWLAGWAWSGVRCFGFIAFGKHRKKEKADAL